MPQLPQLIPSIPLSQVIQKIEIDPKFYHTVHVTHPPVLDVGPKLTEILHELCTAMDFPIIRNRILLPAGSNLRWLEFSIYQNSHSNFFKVFPEGPEEEQLGTHGYGVTFTLTGTTIPECQTRDLLTWGFRRFDKFRLHKDLEFYDEWHDDCPSNDVLRHIKNHFAARIDGFSETVKHILERTQQ